MASLTGANIELKGSKELNQALKILPKDAFRLAKAGLRSASKKHLVIPAQGNLRRKTRHDDSILKSVKVSTVKDGVLVGVHNVVGDEFILRFSEYGTAPHTIVPKKGDYLIFKKDGQIIKTKRIEHPGQSATPWFRPAIDKGLPKVADSLEEEVGGKVAARMRRILKRQ